MVDNFVPVLGEVGPSMHLLFGGSRDLATKDAPIS